jgi:hypothetical protein
MNSLVNTTFYPAILLRQRWLGATAGEHRVFDPAVELARIWAAAPLTSSKVGALERWSAGDDVRHGDECQSRRKHDTQPVAYHRRRIMWRSGRVRRTAISGSSLKRITGHIEASQTN